METRSAELLREMYIAFDYGRFGRSAHSTQSQPERGRTLIHRAAFGHARIFRMLNHRQIQLGCESQCFPHDVVIENRLAIIGDSHSTRALQRTKIREHCALAALCRRRDWKNIYDRAAIGMPNPTHPFRRIDHRLCVGHAAYRSKSSSSSSRCAGRDSFFVALAGLAK